MSNKTNTAEMVTSAKSKTAEFVKGKMFDLIAAAVVMAMLALSLGVFELRQITWKEMANILLETLPFYFATIILNDNYYMKGTYAGKSTTAFISIVAQYSSKVNSLTGDQIGKLPDFCQKYNENTLAKMQLAVLRTEALTLEDFNVGYGKHGPLKVMTRKELKEILGPEKMKAVIKARKLKVKGISANIILGSSDNPDITNLGPGEKEMHNRRKIRYAVISFAFIFILTLIAIKQVTQWGWVGIMFIVFKLLYILARSYTKYFEGYQDITISLANHISRKTDIIKEFESEYSFKAEIMSVEVKDTTENGHND